MQSRANSAATMGLKPLESIGGATSTKSIPTTLLPARDSRESRNSLYVGPPGSGFPVPGRMLGSSTSMSTEMNSGMPAIATRKAEGDDEIFRETRQQLRRVTPLFATAAADSENTRCTGAGQMSRSTCVRPLAPLVLLAHVHMRVVDEMNQVGIDGPQTASRTDRDRVIPAERHDERAVACVLLGRCGDAIQSVFRA